MKQSGLKSSSSYEQKHESTFIKQALYFLLFSALNIGYRVIKSSSIFSRISFRLTVSIEASLSDSMSLIDLNGNPHPLTKFQVRMMIMIGWLAFLLAGLMNVLFYKVHPSFVDFNPKRLNQKCFIYLFGRKRVLLAGRKGDFTLYH